MSPTMNIPNLAPPPRSAEAAASDNGAADGDGGAVFARVLQQTQGEPTPAHETQHRTARAPGAGRASRGSNVEECAHKDVPRDDTLPRDTPHSADADDVAASTQVGTAPVDEGAVADDLRGTGTPTGAEVPAQGPLPLVMQPAPAARERIELHLRSDTPASDGDGATPAGSKPTGRPVSRTPLHDPRPSAATASAGEPALSNDTGHAAAVAAPARAAIDNTAVAAPMRAPSFDAASRVESFAPTLTAVAAPRDHAATAVGADTLPQATVHAAIDEPAFGSTIGHQVALWVRDGVQEARLQLHPAELGPVSVQIVLDGQAAHVDFGAAVAATRESIEQSLPALAAALREAGFTLAGGGVSSHTGSGGHPGTPRGRAAGDSGNRSHRDDDADTAPVAVPPRRWARSLVDVFA